MTDQQNLLVLQYLQVFIGILSTLVVTGSLLFLARQTKASQEQAKLAAEANRAMVFTAFLSRLLQIDSFFIEHPQFYDYFMLSKTIAKNNRNYKKVYMSALMLLDLFDGAILQRKSYPQTFPASWWDEWITDMFTTSPILRRVIDERSNWYTKDLVDTRKRADERRSAHS